MKLSNAFFNTMVVYASPWRPVNDNVMGGVSEGEVLSQVYVVINA